MKTKVLIVAFICLLSVGCTNSDKAITTLKRQGYSEIEVNGYAWFACGQDDYFSTSFRAVAPNGDRVEGAVCSGFFKGNTVRLD